MGATSVRAARPNFPRCRDGAQLRSYGGAPPFGRESIWGEVFADPTGFYDPSYPQAPLFTGDAAAIDRRLAAAEAVRAAVNARHIAYPWPALIGASSNAYYATLIAGMGLADVAAPGQLWAPSARRRLPPAGLLDEIVRGASA